jgi:uncharacterized membrane-anchored protein YitT (DUF2179 family)
VTKNKKTKINNSQKVKNLSPAPWIPMKNGIIIISITSVIMAVLTAIRAIPIKGWIEGLLWSLLFGAVIWGIFFLLIFINRLLRR